ncbi:MAG: SsrA-binding protein SmpB [Bacilli bacterium]|nr:SsrA-binding protein SmpB [Bacilli bacterium]
MKSSGIKIIAQNKKAAFNYFLSDFTECGIELKGTEIKSLRVNGATIGDSYIVIRNGNAEIINMYIKPYEQGNLFNHDPLRSRRLLLHKKEIKWFEIKMKQGGFTVVPTKIYLRGGKAKVEIALAKGKKLYDKRETIKERDIKRDMDKGADY